MRETRDRESEVERQRDRETERQRDRAIETDIQTDRDIDIERQSGRKEFETLLSQNAPGVPSKHIAFGYFSRSNLVNMYTLGDAFALRS